MKSDFWRTSKTRSPFGKITKRGIDRLITGADFGTDNMDTLTFGFMRDGVFHVTQFFQRTVGERGMGTPWECAGNAYPQDNHLNP